MAMIRLTGLVLVLCALSGTSLADSSRLEPAGCSKSTALQPSLCKLSLPRISTVSVEQNAVVSPAADPGTDCSGFKLTPSHARRYFASAQVLRDGPAAVQVLDWLPCQATGSLTFANGRKAQWRIEEARTAVLTFEDGEERFLYCPRCRFKPLRW